AAKKESRRMAELAETPRVFNQLLVGRESEVRRLREQLKKIAHGERQCVFVTGGPGSGKTALIESFIDEARRELNGEVSVLVGHCFEQFGGGEPYMPVWEALGQLAREKPSTELSALLARHAEAYVPQAAAAQISHSQA